MVIKDDGIGSKEIVKGIGLAGMEERLNKVMGKFEVSTPKEGGFRLEIQIPLVNIGADELKL
jgi:signal transduction histidine kinase